MKIFIISRGYPTYKNPQWGCFEKDQALALQKLGHEIIFLSIDRRFRISDNNYGISYRNENGFHIYNYKCMIPGSFAQRISSQFYNRIYSNKLLLLFEKVILKHGIPDILYVHYMTNILLVSKIKDKYNCPIVGMEHWSLINKNPLPKYVYERGKIAYNIPDELIAVSSALQKRLYNVWKKECKVIHNMVGDEFNFENRSKKNKCFQFVSIGSLIRRKGFDLLIEAFSKSKLQEHNVRIVIIGDGKERNNIQKLINEKGLKENILLLGSKNKNEIIDILLESDAFVLPSRSETFGVVYIEAMMLGLPVIGTVCGGPEEFITEKNGLLVEAEDIDGLTNALKNMHAGISFYNRNEIIDDCKSKFSSDVISQQLNKVFNDVINKKECKI